MMAQVLSPPPPTIEPQSKPTMNPPRSSPAAQNTGPPSLPPLMTSPPLRSQPGLQRAPSHQYKQRLSTYSARSNNSNTNSHAQSRPQSMAFPQFHSSLQYALVRDFAYPPYHLLHYGPSPDRDSGISTPASETQHRRSSDPVANWSGQKASQRTSQQPWSSSGAPTDFNLPSTSFGDHDGPPYSEDEDLASPVVTSSRHRKNRSNPASLTYGSSGDQAYFVDSPGEATQSPVSFPASSQAESLAVPATGERRRDSHFARMLPNRSYDHTAFELASSPESPGDSDYIDVDENRFSRDYQFTIASPDEEVHGRAVALFDFAQENENELPLVEGQIILISYRHGEGWLVAQDPKTGDTGLVPEEYVRLLRDIEGGLNSLMLNGAGEEEGTPTSDSTEAKTPTQLEHHHNQIPQTDHTKKEKGEKDEYYAPVLSTFSTSREDLEPWPHHLLSGGNGNGNGSQVTTPTLPKDTYSPTKGSHGHERRGSRSRSPAKRKEEVS